MKFKDIETAEQLLQSLNAPISNPGWTMAYYYTNLESLFQIYKNKTLKLSNMTGMLVKFCWRKTNKKILIAET